MVRAVMSKNIQTPEVQIRDRELFSRILQDSRRYWAHILGVFIIQILATPLALLSPVPLKIAVDSAIGDGPVPDWFSRAFPDAFTGTTSGLLLAIALFQLGIIFLMEGRSILQRVLTTWVGERLVMGLRARIFRHAQRLSLMFHDTRGTADTTYRVQYDATAIKSIAIDAAIPAVSSVFMLVSMIYVTSLLSSKLAIIALCICPILFFAARYYNSAMRPKYKGLKRLESNALKVVQEVLTSIRIVKAFGREDSEQLRFLKTSELGLHARTKLSLAEGVFAAVVNVAVGGGTALVIYFGVLEVRAGALTTGELLVVLAYVSQLFGPIKELTKLVQRLQSHLASAARVYELLEEAPEVAEHPEAVGLERAKGRISFSNVSFGYHEGQEILHNLSFEIPPGTKMGIMGPTGAGKSTLVALLLRFFDPRSGTISLDGEDIRRYKLADLRNQFALVLQDVVLFSSSIGENILYARPSATQSEVVAAAKAAGAHDFITALPEGYDTLVGERGMRLSGGERQRISLARAFLKDAPVLILDEPTSSLDNQTEGAIVEALQKLMAGRTTVMIAHRLSTLRHCDAMLRVDGEKTEFVMDSLALTAERD